MCFTFNYECCITGSISGIVVAVVVVLLVSLVSVVATLCLCWKKDKKSLVTDNVSTTLPGSETLNTVSY